MMSSTESSGEFNCSAIGKPGDRLRILGKCSLKRSRSPLPASLPNVNAAAAATRNTVYNIFRLTGELVVDVICVLGAL